MKFKSRPVKVQQPPYNQQYRHGLPSTTHTQPNLSMTAPGAVNSITPQIATSTWTTSSMTFSSGTSPLFSILRTSALTCNTSPSTTTSTITSVRETYSSPLPSISAGVTSSVVVAAVKSLSPVPIDNSLATTAHGNGIVPLSSQLTESNNSITAQDLIMKPQAIEIKASNLSHDPPLYPGIQSTSPIVSNCDVMETGLPGCNLTSYGCNICNKTFPGTDILKKHLKSHFNSHCAVCGQNFQDRLTLAKHQAEVHTTDKVFHCPQCEKGFKELRTLRLHLKIHNSEYPEQCNVCQKVFRTKWQLKQHQMDHGGERPYPCPECAFTCKTKQQLNEHRRKHSGEKAYSCTQCNTRFTYRNGLIKHTKLNRCPKKIITAEGETIVKKRSRTSGNQNNGGSTGNSSETDSKPSLMLTNEIDAGNTTLDIINNPRSFASLLASNCSPSAIFNTSTINSLSSISPIKGSSILSTTSSPMTTFTDTSQLIKSPYIDYGRNQNIAMPFTSNMLPYASITLPNLVPTTESVVSSLTSNPSVLPMSPTSHHMLSNKFEPNAIASPGTPNLTASRIIAIPTASMPITPAMTLPPLVKTTATSANMGTSLPTYLNPGLLSEILLAGGNLTNHAALRSPTVNNFTALSIEKGGNDGIGHGSVGIIHHALPINTTIYPVSERARSIEEQQSSASLPSIPKNTSFKELNLCSLLPNPRSLTNEISPYGVVDASSAFSSSINSSTIHPTENVQSTQQTVKDGVLPDSTIAELSAATGLPSADIAAWATKLPAGSTVKVTRHFDTALASIKNKTSSGSAVHLSTTTVPAIPIKLPDNISITATHSLFPAPPKLLPAPANYLALTTLSDTFQSVNTSGGSIIASHAKTAAKLVDVPLPSLPSASLALPSSETLEALRQNILLKEFSDNKQAEYLINPDISFQSAITSNNSKTIPLSTGFCAQNQKIFPISSCSNGITSNATNVLPNTNPSDIPPLVGNIYQDGEDITSHLLAPNSSCFGLPSYKESFAVDPNEVLSKHCHPNSSNSDCPLSSAPVLNTASVKPYLDKRKRQQMEYKDVDGLSRKSSQLEGVLLKCDIDLNSNINNNNHVAAVKIEAESDPLTLIVANEDVNSFPNFESDQFNLSKKCPRTENIHLIQANVKTSPIKEENPVFPFSLPGSPQEKNKNVCYSFINDANSRLLNSRHNTHDSSTDAIQTRSSSPSALIPKSLNSSSGNIKREDADQINQMPLNITKLKESSNWKTKVQSSQNKSSPEHLKKKINLEHLNLSVPYSDATSAMVIDSSGSSVASSTYNSGEEGEYSNGACSGGTDDITGSNPFIFGQYTRNNSFGSSVSSRNGSSDEYFCNPLSSRSTTPIHLTAQSDKGDCSSNSTSSTRTALATKLKADNNTSSIPLQRLCTLPPPSTMGASLAEPMSINANQTNSSVTDTDFDMEVLDMIPPPTSILGMNSNTWEDPPDFSSGHELCLNDHDFRSMKSIVEQAFKDGRDVLDIISAV